MDLFEKELNHAANLLVFSINGCSIVLKVLWQRTINTGEMLKIVSQNCPGVKFFAADIPIIKLNVMNKTIPCSKYTLYDISPSRLDRLLVKIPNKLFPQAIRAKEQNNSN